MASVMAARITADSLIEEIPGVVVDVGERPARLREITDVGRFETLRPLWDELLAQDPNATIFQSWEWQFTWWRHFGGGKLHILLVSDPPENRALCAIAPLTTRPYVLPWLRELSFVGSGVSDYLDLICLPDCAPSAMKAVVDFIRSGARRWDFVDLHQIPPGGAALMAAEFVDEVNHGLSAEYVDHETCASVPLPDSWEEYRKSLGKSLRFNIGYSERSLGKLFNLSVGRATEDDLDNEMDTLFRLHGRRWRSRRQPGVLAGGRIRRFHKDVARALMDRGRLRLYYLKLDGVTQAALYCFAFKDTMYYYLGGFEPRLAKYGLGTILTAHAIRDAIESGMSRFDMLRGREDYKNRWGSKTSPNSRLLISKPDARSRTARALHGLERRIEHAYKERAVRPRGAKPASD